MSSDILIPSATATISISGLAVCCYNSTFNNNRGRWEIAIPRFTDHELIVEVPGIGSFFIQPNVKFIEIRDLASFAVEPTYEVPGALNRQDLNTNINDFRWVTNFCDVLALPNLSLISRHTTPNPVNITMLYVYDAIAYTKILDPSKIIRPALDTTAPLVDNAPTLDEVVLPILRSGITDFVFEAKAVGLDIQSFGGKATDILIDRAKALSLPHVARPQKIDISNLEPKGKGRASRTLPIPIPSHPPAPEDISFSLGDFYRYYQLLDVTVPKIHQWGLHKGPGTDGDCCCNPGHAPVGNLDALL